MIKKILKVTGWTLLSIVVFSLISYVYVRYNIKSRLEKKYDVAAQTFEITNDSASLATGAHLIAIKGCTECHGSNLEGKVMNDDGVFGRLVATNLTQGKGGLSKDYNTEDWINALQHGLSQDNTPLIFMPSHELAKLSEEDMGYMIAYLEQLPPRDQELPKMELGFLAYILGYLDMVPLIPAEKIDHEAALIKTADKSSFITYGQYLAISCSSCHRENMKGGEPLGPGMPPVPDLTRTGTTGRWTVEDFIKALRTGELPDGHIMDNDHMPWRMTAHYTDEELRALYAYFKSLK